MVDVVIVGSIGIDDIKTPFGDKKNLLGGSAVYASYASSFFAKTGMVSIAGEDLAFEHKDLLEKRGICIAGVEFIGKNFRWTGEYKYDMNEAKTIETQLNSLVDFHPDLPEEYRNAKYVLLGNIDPVLQLKVIDQLKEPELILLDTMNYWIDAKKKDLLEVIKKVHVLLLNDAEARQLFDTVSLIQCGRQALTLGPKFVIIKKGEHGALLFSEGKHFNAPGYPLEILKDPTGCGDSFAGGFLGYLAKTKDISEPNIRKAIIYGSTIASFNAEDFSLERQKQITLDDIEKRFEKFREIRKF